jgi:MFS family permease
MKQHLSFPRMLALNAYWVGLSFKWNALTPIILPAVLVNFVPDAQKNTYLGILTFIGLIIAMIVQPVAGAISDGWSSRWGRRRPFIVFGTLFDFIFLVILGWAGGLTWLFIGYIGLQFSSNIAHGPAQGLLPDRTPKDQMGVVSSLKIFMDMFSLIVASLLAGRLFDPVARDPSLILFVIITTIAISTAITIFGTPEEPTHDRAGIDWRGLIDQFRIDFRANAAYWWLIAERAFFLLGIFGVQAFAQYYIQDVLRVPNPVQETGDLLASITIGLIALALIGGWLADRFGPKRILYAASITASMGMILMLFVRDTTGLAVFGSVVGAGIGLFLTANWALANKLAPPAEAGKYLGFTNIATAGSGALARLEGPAIDALNAFQPGAWLGYTALFLFGAIITFASMFLLRKIDVE